MMELSAVGRIHRVTRGKSRMASYSKTIPVCCGSSFTIGGHFDVSSAYRKVVRKDAVSTQNGMNQRRKQNQ